MQILRRLPFRDTPATGEVRGETVEFRAFQIIVWVSLSAEESLPDDAARFPAVLDTGHSHNFSIQQGQLARWVGIQISALETLGTILVNRQEVPLGKASLWIHRNRPGLSELLGEPYRLPIPQGVAVYPAGTPGEPRLPLLGLRGLIRNKLKLTIDGENLTVSLRE